VYGGGCVVPIDEKYRKSRKNVCVGDESDVPEDFGTVLKRLQNTHKMKEL
jgi:hypothetical protein